MNQSVQFRQIFDSLLTAVLVLDRDLVFNYVNNAAEVLFEISEDQIIGKEIFWCLQEIDGGQESFSKALQGEQQYTKRKAKWRLHTGEEITVDYSIIPNLEIDKLIIEVQPLDRLIQISQDEAFFSNQITTKNLIKSLSHEIKNPLGGIRGAAQLLARELQSEAHNEYTQIIIDEADRLRNLVDLMLGPRRPGKHSPCNIHELLEHVITISEAQQPGVVTYTKDYDPSIPSITGDRNQLIQALMNVLQNAVQSLCECDEIEQKVIVVRTRVKRRYTIGRKHFPLVVEASIIDNGPGIPPELIDNIFFPMITGRAEGTGLGLSIAQDLISQHHGLIKCSSETGRTEFSFYLPMDQNYAET